MDILCEPIQKWLFDKSIKEVSVIDIITKCFNGSLENLTQRQLEIRIGKCLKQLGWIKVRKRMYNVWIQSDN